MRRALVPIITALVLGLTAAPASATIIDGAVLNKLADVPQAITFANFAYTPSALAVSPSGVSWSGALGSHPLVFEDGSPGSSSGTLFQRDLRPGVVHYYCAIHGAPNGVGMSGVVYVAGPAAKLSATPASLDAPGTVALDASGTDFVDYAPNTTATYAFDTDGDGTFDTAGGSPATQASFPVGARAARVRVTDDDGRTGEASVTVRVREQTSGQPGAEQPGGGAPQQGGADDTPPSLRAAGASGLRLRKLVAGRIRLLVGTLSEAATVRVTLHLRGQTIARAPTRTAGPGELSVTLRTTAAGRRALRGLRRAWLVLRLDLADAAGNRRIIERRLTARR